jgi:hypothetical protein
MFSLKKTEVLFLVIAAFSVASCSKNEDLGSYYYPVDSLVTSQINYLSNARAVLNKHGEIDGIKEDTTFTPGDSAAWARELDVFTLLNDINKPVNQGSYQVEDALDDPRSNLTIKSMTSLADLPITYLKIYYQEDLSRIRKLEAVYRDENSLMKGSRMLTMEFQEINNKNVLTSYSIEGSQKMFLGKSVEFQIIGAIIID